MALQLLLIRHGQIKANVEKRWHGSTDSPLTRTGKRQAKKLGAHFKKSSLNLSAIYTSALMRTQQTAVPMSEHLEIEPQVNADLGEYHIGEWEAEFFKILHEERNFVAKATTDPNYRPPGGESLNEVATRITQAITEIHDRHQDDECVAIVSHGAAMAIALGVLVDGDPARWTDYHFSNCSITELVMRPTPHVNQFNQITHL